MELIELLDVSTLAAEKNERQMRTVDTIMLQLADL
jgi:hypothetical protein